MKRYNTYFWLIPTTCFVVLDEWVKAIGLERLPDDGSLIDPGIITFAIHKNWGMAFDVPFKLEFIILFSILIGMVLLHEIYKTFRNNHRIALACGFIILGASGNLYDRIVYGFTVDYILLLGHSAINLSDLVIIFGVILLLLASRKQRRERKQCMTSATDTTFPH